MKNKIVSGVREYYSKKIVEFGLTPQGVDWNSKDSQYLRFAQLCKVINRNKNFSLLDFGCGYGELNKYLKEMYQQYSYFGFDISPEMIRVARENSANDQDTRFLMEIRDDIYDYVVASGIFNVKLDLASEADWLIYVQDNLDIMNKHAKSGFSFNALTKYSDKNLTKEYLYYADPLFLFDHCKLHYSKNVALLHDYDLYEFTIIVRK